jgi:excinuclease ABC subunit C
MRICAKKEAFEEAHVLKQKIFALTHINDIALLKDDSRVYRDERSIRIEAYDIAHLGGDDMVGVMTVLEGGEPDKSSYRKFKIHTVTKSNDTASLKEVLERRFTHSEWVLPQVLVVDGGVAQKNAAESVLRKHEISIPVIGVVKDEKHNPKRIIGAQKVISQHQNAILLANAEAHRFAIAYHRERRRKRNVTTLD